MLEHFVKDDLIFGSEPSQNTILSGLVSWAALSTQVSIGVATPIPRKI
jgi:hypothetical protein